MANKDREKMDESHLYTIAEVAKALKVSDETVRRWCRKGAIPYVMVGPFKLKRITHAELERQRRDAGIA